LRGEALYHLALDLGMVGFTIGVLWLCLRKYRPMALGWFRRKIWPPMWALKVIVACAVTFPIAIFLGNVSQVLPNFSVSDLTPWRCQIHVTPFQGGCMNLSSG